MHSAIKNEEEKKEYIDSPEELDVKLTVLADMIKNSKHMVCFTGAGISTACGIPDYRSGVNTILETGPGVWETAANKKKYEEAKRAKAKSVDRTAKRKAPALAPAPAPVKTPMQKAYPSKTHMALVEMHERNYLKHIVSQNLDGLHRKSGIPREAISELHGNTNLEICEKCGNEYMRDFKVRTALKVHDHKTGRKCDDPTCKGDLKDSIINFGEHLNRKILDCASENHTNSDLCIVMGSSLRVAPASILPT